MGYFWTVGRHPATCTVTLNAFKMFMFSLKSYTDIFQAPKTKHKKVIKKCSRLNSPPEHPIPDTSDFHESGSALFQISKCAESTSQIIKPPKQSHPLVILVYWLSFSRLSSLWLEKNCPPEDSMKYLRSRLSHL